MSKGSWRRPMKISDKEYEDRWGIAFGTGEKGRGGDSPSTNDKKEGTDDRPSERLGRNSPERINGRR